jgi:hypothetical protein
MLRPLFAALLFIAPAMAAEPASLAWPVDCALGETCWLMNYPDADPGPQARDFRCRPRSYDRHDGTDIAVRDARAMADGVAVLAAAPGEVLRVRDGEPDGALLAGAKVAGKECGNAVMVRLDNGWQARYCHMRKGSVVVRPGQRIATGDRLGLVGLSGMTEFPHLHLDIQDDGKPVDPFTGARLTDGCGKRPEPLWASSPGYQPAALNAVGFADHIPAGKDIKADASSPTHLSRTAPALVFWSTAFGVAPRDRMTLTVTGPNGRVVVKREIELEKDQAWRMEAIGKRTPKDGWPAGPYRGETRLERAGQPPLTRAVTIDLN